MTQRLPADLYSEAALSETSRAFAKYCRTSISSSAVGEITVKFERIYSAGPVIDEFLNYALALSAQASLTSAG